MPLKSQRPLIASVAWGKPGVIIGVRCSRFPDRVDVYGWPIQLACSSPSLAKHVVGGVAGWRLLIPVTDWSMDMKLEDILAIRDAMPLIVFWRMEGHRWENVPRQDGDLVLAELLDRQVSTAEGLQR